MFTKHHIILILIINITTTSCTINSDRNLQYSSMDLYKSAQNKLLQKKYSRAVQDLLNLKNLYLFEPCKQQIYLDLIYAYYKSNNLKLSNDYIQQFLQLYPNHKHLDYVLYMHGIINMNLDKNHTTFFTKYLSIYHFDHDPIYANVAFQSFLKIIKNYPNSQYFIDSYKRLIILKNRIAKHELAIVKFYNKKHAYISVINRSEKILHYFPDTESAYQTLYYIKQAYNNIHLLDQSHIINKIIAENSTTY